MGSPLAPTLTPSSSATATQPSPQPPAPPTQPPRKRPLVPSSPHPPKKPRGTPTTFNWEVSTDLAPLMISQPILNELLKTSLVPRTTGKPTAPTQTAPRPVLETSPPLLEDTQPTPAIPTAAYQRHEHEGNKQDNWFLVPNRPIILMGDSNLCRLPKVADNRVQVDAYPGATIYEITQILRYRTPPSNTTQTVLISVGINNKDQSNPTLIRNLFSRLLGAAHHAFPNATIRIPVINFSKGLTPRQQRNLCSINDVIKELPDHIPRLRDQDFLVDDREIHWTKNTGIKMLAHWKTHLN